MKKKNDIKQIFIEFAKEHKKNCRGKDCKINLYLLRDLLEVTGRKLSKKEQELFW